MDEIVRSRTADAGIEFPVRAHPLENIVLHHRPGRVIVREHADTAAVFKAAFFHRNPVGISDSDDIRPDGAEGAMGDFRTLEAAHIKADQAVLGIFAAVIRVCFEGKAGEGYPAESAVRHL